MDKEANGLGAAHVLLMPYPAQGHINPIFQFAKRLSSKGLKATVAITVFVSKTSVLKPDGKVGVEKISDGFDETGPSAAGTGEVLLSRLKEEGSRTLAEIIRKHEKSCNPITCLVYDSICPWALDVAKELGLLAAAFFPQSATVCSIYYRVDRGLLPVPFVDPIATVPSLPPLARVDLPSPVQNSEERIALELLKCHFLNLEKADWFLMNTFDKLESEVLKNMAKLFPLKTIGPTVPSLYLDKQVDSDTDYCLNLFKPSDSNCMEWLNRKEKGSVLYVSFGSMAELGEEQLEEIIWGIRQANKCFLWVVREMEQNKLPSDFVEVAQGTGLVVSWCSQLEVLAHEAVGCFMSHCGWNSTLEAMCLGVPIVAVPHIWDQPTNAKTVETVFGMGVRAQMNEKGIVSREELEMRVREIMEGERGKMMKRNATKWMELAKEAMSQGGSSDVNIDEFVASLVRAKK